MNKKILYIVLIVICNFELFICDQYFVETPKNISVLVGEDVILRCAIKNQKGEVSWCKEDSFCTFGRRRNFSDPRISLLGDEAKGEHHLFIKNVSIYDNTQYQCQVTANMHENAIKSDWAFLTVLVKPKSVNITPNNKEDTSSIRLATNMSTSIECISENSNPPCNFTWFFDSKELKVGGEIIEISRRPYYINSTRLFKTIGKIGFRPITNNWHLKNLKCECLIEPSVPSSLIESDTKSVFVNYSPLLKIWKISDIDIVDGSFIQFECVSDSRPPVNFYRWHIGNKVLSSGANEKYLYLRIESNMHKQQLKCDAKNDVSTQTTSYLIELSYGPRFNKELPSHKMVKINEELLLNCEVDSNPASLIFWTLNETSVYAYPTLRIISMKPENYGTYRCTASLKDFPKVSSSVKVVPPGPPVVDAVYQQYAYFGHEGSLECLIEKEPKADIIEWFKSDIKIDFSKSFKYKLNNAELPRKGVKSYLVIKEVNEEDFSNFTCKASNVYGSSTATVNLKPKVDEMGDLFPLVVIFIFMFIGTGILVFFVFKKFIKQKTRNKRIKKTKPKHDPFRAKPSMMLRGIDNRGFQRRYNNYLNRPVINRSKYNNFANHKARLPLPIANFSQFRGNEHEFNPINFEYAGIDSYFSPSLYENRNYSFQRNTKNKKNTKEMISEPRYQIDTDV